MYGQLGLRKNLNDSIDSTFYVDVSRPRSHRLWLLVVHYIFSRPIYQPLLGKMSPRSSPSSRGRTKTGLERASEIERRSRKTAWISLSIFGEHDDFISRGYHSCLYEPREHETREFLWYSLFTFLW